MNNKQDSKFVFEFESNRVTNPFFFKHALVKNVFGNYLSFLLFFRYRYNTIIFCYKSKAKEF